MTDNQNSINHHFLSEYPDEDGDKFLEERLSYISEKFSYERLSGSSVEGLNYQREFFKLVIDDTYREFMNEESIFTGDSEIYAYVAGEELDLYEPLTPSQRKQIESVITDIDLNFDKAREDARDRNYERLSMIVNSIPL